MAQALRRPLLSLFLALCALSCCFVGPARTLQPRVPRQAAQVEVAEVADADAKEPFVTLQSLAWHTSRSRRRHGRHERHADARDTQMTDLVAERSKQMG